MGSVFKEVSFLLVLLKPARSYGKNLLWQENFLLILWLSYLLVCELSSPRQVDLTENAEDGTQLSIQELCADHGTVVADFIKQLQTREQDAENTIA